MLPYLSPEKQGVRINGLAILRQGKMITLIKRNEVPIYYLMNGNDYPDHITMLLPSTVSTKRLLFLSSEIIGRYLADIRESHPYICV